MSEDLDQLYEWVRSLSNDIKKLKKQVEDLERVTLSDKD